MQPAQGAISAAQCAACGFGAHDYPALLSTGGTCCLAVNLLECQKDPMLPRRTDGRRKAVRHATEFTQTTGQRMIETACGVMRCAYYALRAVAAMVYLAWEHDDQKRELSVVAEQWYRRACTHGSGIAAYYLTHGYLRSERITNAIDILNPASQAGYAPATYLLGKIYYVGRQGEIDIERARAYFEKAVAEGHILANRKMALIQVRYGPGLMQRIRGIFCLVRTAVIFFNAGMREGIYSPRILS